MRQDTPMGIKTDLQDSYTGIRNALAIHPDHVDRQAVIQRCIEDSLLLIASYGRYLDKDELSDWREWVEIAQKAVDSKPTIP